LLLTACIRSGDSPLHLSILSFVDDSKYSDFSKVEVEVERTLFLLEAGARVETRNRSDKKINTRRLSLRTCDLVIVFSDLHF
jgi:hypothetical protein